jgi:arylsulfatase A
VEHPQSAIRKGDLKLLYFWDTRQAQLFDLAQDLAETHDLAREQPEKAAALEQELKAHVRAGLGDAAVAALERGERPQGPGGPGRPPAKKKQAKKKARP